MQVNPFDSCAATLMPWQQKEFEYSNITINGSKRDHIWYQA